MTKQVAVLGSTGSIGRQTLDVIAALPEQLTVAVLAAGRNVDLLAEQIARFKPKIAVIQDDGAAERLKSQLNDRCAILTGSEGLCAAVEDSTVDIVVTSLVGAAGILPTLAAIRAGKDIALANKETLVAAGSLVMEEARKYNVRILPVDSEHSAIFQCIQGLGTGEIERIILTASGGPFRGFTKEQLTEVTRAAALKHPNWSMGPKITVDSATMMNKGLEVIEAKWLFEMGWDAIEVVVHPQSIIHSMVETVDGAILAQLGPPDMRAPIQYALTYPARKENRFSRLDFTTVNALQFAAPDRDVFPALNLAYYAGRAGGTAPAVLNAANEAAVALFLEDCIPFLRIVDLVQTVLDTHHILPVSDLETIFEADAWARREVQRLYNIKGGGNI